MVGMRGWSFPIGRFLGVDVRIHTFFLLLLGLSISYASAAGATGLRGFGLWALLLLAVVVRETARAVGAAWFGLDLRSMLLLPTGGLFSYATSEATEKAETPEMQRARRNIHRAARAATTGSCRTRGSPRATCPRDSGNCSPTWSARMPAGCQKGRRPSFIEAARPEIAEPLYEQFVNDLRALGIPVATGKFGADMQVSLINDGPVTFWLEAP